MMEYTVAYAKEHDYLPYYLYRQKNIADNLENIGYAVMVKRDLQYINNGRTTDNYWIRIRCNK